MSKNDNQTNTGEVVADQNKTDSGPSEQGDTRGKAANVNPVQDHDKVILNAPGSDFSELKKSDTAHRDDQPLDNTPAGKAAHNDDGRDMTQDEPHIKDQVDLNNDTQNL